MAGLRLYLTDFAVANPLYSGATVYVYEVDPATQTPTTTLATIYDDIVGSGLLTNPLQLDDEGKWQQAPYVETAVVMEVQSAQVESHTTGISGVQSSYRGDWTAGQVYLFGDTVRDGAAGDNTLSIYICVDQHTAGAVWADDLAAGKWQLFIQVPAAGNYVARTGDTMSGKLTISSGGLQLGASTATGFGTAIGQAPLWVNFQASGFPGLLTTSRLIFGRQTAAASDFADIQINRTTTSVVSAVTTNQNAALRVIGVTGPQNQSAEWGIVSQVTNNQNTGAGNTVAIVGYGFRTQALNGAFTFGGVFGSFDSSGLTSANSKGPLLAAEMDVAAYDADDAVNGQMFGGKGARVVLNIVGMRQSAIGTSQTEISQGIWFSTTTNPSPSGTDAYTNFNSLIGVAVNVQAYQMLDARGMIAPTGYSGAPAAVRMLAGQIIDFNGNAVDIKGAASDYLQFETTGIPRLLYKSGSNENFSVSASSGNVITRGTLQVNSASSAALTLSGGTIAVPNGQNMTVNMGGNNATLTFAGTSGTGTPLRLTASTTQNVIDTSLTSANLTKTSRLFVSPGTITFSGARSDTGTPFSASFNSAGDVSSTTDYPYYWWRLNSDIATTTQSATGLAINHNVGVTPWAASTAYSLGAQVENDNGRVYQVTVAGTSAGAGGPTGTGATIIDNTVTWTYVGANSTGGRTGLRIDLTARGTTGNSRAGQDSYYEGVRSSVRAAFNYGGTNALLTGAKGHQFSYAGYSYALSGTTYLYANVGYEQDMIIESGVTVARQMAFHPVKLAASVTQAVVTDAAILIGNAAGAIGWRDGILFADPGDVWGIDTTNGTLMRARLGNSFLSYPASAKDGVNIQEATFSGSSFLTRGAAWDGSGTIRVGTGVLTATTTGIQLDATYSVGVAEGTVMTGATLVSGGTGGFAVNDVLRSANNGVIYVTAVNGSNQITSATIYRRSYATGSPAVNENYTPDPSSNGTGTVTIAQTWTAGSDVTIAGASKKVAFYGGTPQTKQTVTGAKGGNVALANLMTALANLGLLTDSTT